jgi:predicted negative regulator of RcsB-dependent stress response
MLTLNSREQLLSLLEKLQVCYRLSPAETHPQQRKDTQDELHLQLQKLLCADVHDLDLQALFPPATLAEAELQQAHAELDQKTAIPRDPHNSALLTGRLEILIAKKVKFEAALQSANQRGQQWKAIALAHGASAYILDHPEGRTE